MSEDRSVFDLVEPSSGELISFGDSADQVIELFRATGTSKKSIGLIHGGYWRPEYDRAHLRPYAVRLASEGFDTYLIEYVAFPDCGHFELIDPRKDSIVKMVLRSLI